MKAEDKDGNIFLAGSYNAASNNYYRRKAQCICTKE